MLQRYDPKATSNAPSAAACNASGMLQGHMPVLDGVRGLAVAMVLVFHFIGAMTPTNGVERFVVRVTNYGSFGVELFFVLSGFLITGILYDSCNKPRYFRNFYGRRALRIFPVYYGVLALVFFVAPLIPLLQGPTLDYLVERQWWAWLYGVNIYIAQTGDWSFSYIEHFWSLAIEEHFYLVWPLVVFLTAKKPKTLMAVCLGVALCAVLGRVIGLFAGLSYWTTYVFTLFRLDGLALGAFLAVAARQPGGLGRLAGALPAVLAVSGGLLSATYLFDPAWKWMPVVTTIRAASVQALLACLLVWAVTASERSPVKRFLCSRTMVTLGAYSYGLYVYHHFFSYYFIANRTEFELAGWVGSHGLAVALQATAGLAASVVIAYLSYELFEKRFLKLKRVFDTPAPDAGPVNARAKSARPSSAAQLL